jgi:hypothetical protein
VWSRAQVTRTLHGRGPCFEALLGALATPSSSEGLQYALAVHAFALVCIVAAQFTSYVDESGTTHYVESPNQVPAKYRKKSKVTEAEVSTVTARKPTDAERLARETAAAAEARKTAAPNAPPTVAPAPDPDSPAERRRKYDQARLQLKTVCRMKGGRRECTQVPIIEAEGLKAGESCRPAGAPCTIPPECCANNCNKNTFTCD